MQSDQYIPVEDIHVEMGTLERQLDELEQRGVELEQRLRNCSDGEESVDLSQIDSSWRYYEYQHCTVLEGDR